LGITDVRLSHLINITYIHTYVPTVFERCESDCGNSCGGFGYVFATFLIPVAVTDVVMFRLRGGKRLYGKPILATRRRVTSWRLRRRLSCRQHASIFIGFIRSGSASRRVASRRAAVTSLAVACAAAATVCDDDESSAERATVRAALSIGVVDDVL